MPKLPAIHDDNLRALARELRFAPRAALIRHIERAEELAAMLEPEQRYPHDWAVFRITGFRPDVRNAASSSGADLLASLSAFVEHLCESAQLAAEELGEGAVPADALCQRWGVSRKTLDRARRQGLVGRRVRSGSGRLLMFTERAVDAYEHRAAPAAKPAGRRMPASVRNEIIQLARQERAAHEWSINHVARRLAPRFGFSPEALRRMLKQHDEQSSGGAIFAEQGPPNQREQELAFRALRRGLDPGEVAERLGRTRSAVWRASLIYRARRLTELQFVGPVAPVSARPATEERCSCPALARFGDISLASELHRFLDQARHASTLTRNDERDIATAMHVRRARAQHAIAALSRSNPPARELDRIETDLRAASQLKIPLLISMLPLLLRTLERRLEVEPEQLPPRELLRYCDALIAALSRAADRFDPAHGGRLAAPAGIALDRTLASWQRQHESAKPGRARRAASLRFWQLASPQQIDPWLAFLNPDPRLRSLLADLPEHDAELLARRFGLAGHTPSTIDDIAAWLGIPHMHAVRRERKALRAALARARSTLP